MNTARASREARASASVQRHYFASIYIDLTDNTRRCGGDVALELLKMISPLYFR